MKKFNLTPNMVLLGILLISVFVRFFRLDFPRTYAFDEVYHAFTAKEFVLGHPQAWQWWNSPPPGVAYEWTHPPFAKEVMAASMWLFGSMEPFFYRLPGTILGIVSIYLVYLITKTILKSEKTGLIAAFLFSLDGLNFVQSRTGMNDIYFVTSILAALYLFLKERYLFSSILVGVALSSKWTTLYFLPMIFILFLLNKIHQKLLISFVGIAGLFMLYLKFLPPLPIPMTPHHLNIDFLIKSITAFPVLLVYVVAMTIITAIFKKYRNVLYFTFIPVAVYLASYIPFFLLGHSWETFIELQKQMWWYHTNLKATHDYASPWWSWPLNLFPVWYYVQYYPNGWMSNIFNSGNPVLFWGGAISVLLTLYECIVRRSKKLAILLLGYFVFWLPWALSPRIMFFYHYSPSVPFMCMAFAYQLTQILEADPETIHLKKPIHGFIKQPLDYLGFYILSIIFYPTRYLSATNTPELLSINKIYVYVILGLVVLSFLFIYPMITALPLPKAWALLFFQSNITKNPFGN
jgi:dolichyl-phosphate-mannose-protein mannosyltransferase